jgi:drug/metabolite transporter (DMT)-like permease
MMAVAVRVATRTMMPVQVACVRFAGSFVLLLALSGGRGLRPRAESHLRLVQRAVLGTIAILLYFVGIGWAGAGRATLLHSTHPVFATLFAILFMDETFTGRTAAAVAMNVVGAAVVVGSGLGEGPRVGLGSLAALGGGMLAGGSVATASLLRRTESATLVTTYFMGVGALLLAPSLLVGLPPLSVELVLALVGVIVTSTLGQWLLHHGLGFTNVVAGSLAAATSVVTAAVVESFATSEQPALRVVLAGLLMVAGVGLASRPTTPGGTASRPTARDR